MFKKNNMCQNLSQKPVKSLSKNIKGRAMGTLW